MIFLTVGTSFPFDRLVKAVDTAITDGFVEGNVFAQIGAGGYRPKHMEYVERLGNRAFDTYFQGASAVISHAGVGSIAMALEFEKPLLVMPRQKIYREVVNDHQLAIAKKYELLKYVLVAYEVEQLPEKLEQLRTFVPCRRKPEPRAVAERIARFLIELDGARKQGGQ
ncbi:MAG TPA: glycosyltransferase [Sedimentisphaerales bacterium]|nr:glycosyltransferase [Sedimentisphaerales bacterium]